MRALFLIMLGCPIVLHAQDLLSNGDFEQYSLCPDYVSQIERAVGWQRPTNGTSDYFNACLGVPFSMSVPDNQMGNETALSGNGYAGFYCFYDTGPFTTPGDNDHEYVTRELVTPMVSGKAYTVEFFVSLADVSKYAVNDIGALFSMAVPVRQDEFPIEGTPQITHGGGSWLDQKTGWTRITGCFIADSAYRYITIGNFRDGASTAFLEVPTQFPLTYFSYYYLDDVSVSSLEPPLLGPDLTTCTAETISVLNPVVGAEYHWSTGANGTSITVDTTGEYIVTRTDQGCLLSDTIIISVGEPYALSLPTDTTSNLCTSPIELSVGTLPTGSSVLWSTGATTPVLFVTQAGSYSIAITVPGSCPASSSIEVYDDCSTAPYAPSAFTPNGDGINDIWLPIWSAHPHAELRFTVFDRWGREVHTGYRENGWDGNSTGEHAPIGNYVYTLEAKDPTNGLNIRRTGSITLVR
jgi:gliding motility-associated-like protein